MIWAIASTDKEFKLGVKLLFKSPFILICDWNIKGAAIYETVTLKIEIPVIFNTFFIQKHCHPIYPKVMLKDLFRVIKQE